MVPTESLSSTDDSGSSCNLEEVDHTKDDAASSCHSDSSQSNLFLHNDDTVLGSILSLPLQAKFIIAGILVSFVGQVILGMNLPHP